MIMKTAERRLEARRWQRRLERKMNTPIETNGGAQDASVFASKDLLSGEKSSSEIYRKAWLLQMDRAQIGINALAKIQEGNYGSEDVKCIAHDALDAIERATKCQACKGTGMIRNDQSNQGWDDCPHCK